MGGLNPLVKVDAEDFAGLRTNSDPRDLAPGEMQVQTNMICQANGMIQGRLGNRPGTFANGQSPVAGAVYSMMHYNAPNRDWVVYQQDDGTIRAGYGFS